MILKKRGVSAVVATVLIILITVGAVAIVASFVIPFVRDTLSKSTECVGLDKYFGFEEDFDIGGVTYEYNCIVSGNDTNYYGVSVRNAGGDTNRIVKGFILVFNSEDGTSDSVRVLEGRINGDVKVAGEDFDEIIEVPDKGEVLTYVYKTPNNYESMEIYPLSESGSACPTGDEIGIILCDRNVEGLIK